MIMLACVLSNLSQIPELMNNSLLVLAYNAMWILTAFILLLRNKTIDIRYFILPLIFDVFIFLAYLGRGKYLSSDLFRPINLCTFILLIGIWAGKYLEYKELRLISSAYVVSAMVVAVSLYVNVFRGVDWASSGYLYGSKNSAGQIFLVGAILLATQFINKYKIASIMGIFFFCILIFMMKSRASIVTLLMVILYLVLFGIKKPAYKLLGISAILIVIYIVLNNEALYNLYINEIMFNNKDINDISAITSDRDIHFAIFKKNIGRYWLIGTGGTYLESMPLAILLSYGVLGGIPVLLYSVMPFFIAIKELRVEKYRLFCTLIIALNLIMWVNGIFEEQSPFGPGVKCYFLWLVTGLFIGYRKNCKEKCYGKY